MSGRNDLGLGYLIKSKQFRDAIHIAVAPVIADCNLKVGEHVGLIKTIEGKDYVGRSPTKIGIVDPSLQKPVKKKDEFWLFLYPNTVTSLRHDWTHPAFQPSDSNTNVVESINWLTKFASHFDLSYSKLIDILDNYREFGEGYCLPFDTPDETWTYRKEMWEHYEIVTGKKINEDMKEDSYVFSCAC